MSSKGLLWVILCIQWMFPKILNSQDIHFSQFNMAPSQQNPALAGAMHDLQAILQYREQWRSVMQPYTTIAASLDMRLNRKRAKTGFLAAGMSFYSDKAGSSRMGTSQGNLSLAYQVKINRYNLLGAGIQGSFAQWGFQTGSLQWGKQYQAGVFNSSLPSGEQFQNTKMSFFDVAGGLNWTYNNTSGAKMVTDNHDQRFTAGFAVFHPIKPRYSLTEGPADRLYSRLVIYANGLFSMNNTDLALAPGFFVYNQGPSRQIFAGTMLRYKLRQDSKYTGFEKGAAISPGVYMRSGDGVVASLLVEFSRYAIGLSYDFNTSAFKNATGTHGAFEISLRFVNPNPFMHAGSRSRI